MRDSMRWFLSWITLSAIIAGLSDAHERQDTMSVLYSWHPTEEACNSSIATRVSLEDLLSASETYQGKCVRTVGYYTTPALFVRERDLHRSLPVQNENSAQTRLGIYATQSQFDQLFLLEDSKVEVVGQISSCTALYDENPGMVLGYCHHTLGPIIGLAVK